ncbi:MAG TPA: type 4a pilus biogenesis protein PilO, partial [bacterium]|nr:type 4a pilus biogenesis protein PilO [bacterium]
MKISPKDLKKLVIVSTISFLILWKLYILDAALKKIDDQKNLLIQQKTEIANEKIKYAELLEKKIEYLINKEKNKELEFYLIKNKSELLNIISDIYAAANNSGAKIISSNTGKSVKYSDYYINNFLNINLQGSFKNILSFFELVNKNKYLIQANEIELKKI